MKKLFCAMTVLICVLWLSASVYAEQCEEKELTLMVYMCGSNLQHYNNCANVDMAEMEQSEVDPAQVNLVVLTGGSDMENWKSLSLHHLETEWDNLLDSNVNIFQGQNAEFFGSNMGEADTLGSYVRYCVERYPAKKYALILWDHGEGPLGHICHDECNGNDGLSISELVEALKMARLPKKLSWIGFDACLMSTAEVALAVSPYAEYMIASQETEPETGWNYRCLKGIEGDENGAVTGTRFINAYLEGNRGMIGLTLSCLDLSKVQRVVDEMDAFFAPLVGSLDKTSFTRLSELRSASTHFGEVVRSVDNGYDLVDLESLVQQFSAFGDAAGVEEALESAVTENGVNMDGARGLSVYHPYYNKDAYLASRGDQYRTMPFSEGYRRYVERFGAILTGSAFADWSGIQLRDEGAPVLNEHMFSLQMSDEQRQNYTSSQLIVLGALGNVLSDAGVYETQFSFEDERDWELECYYPVWVRDAAEGADGLLSAAYTSRCLYITDENGTPVAGPIGYRLSDDGSQIYLFAQYQDNSGRKDAAPMIKVLYTCTADEKTGALSVVNTAVYDKVTMTYTRRLGFNEADYTHMFIDRLARCVPESDGALPAFADWIKVVDSIELSLPLKWGLRFLDAQLSGTQLYATMQITDTQQNSYCTPLIPVENPNLYDINVSPRTFSGNGFELTLYAVMDHSPLEPGLNIGFEVDEDTGWLSIDSVVINGTRDTGFGGVTLTSEDRRAVFHIDETALAGLERIDSITVELGSRGINSGNYKADTFSTAVFQLSNGGLDSAGPLSKEPLCQVSEDGAAWQLVGLTFNQSGDLEGLLHIVNTSDEAIRRSCNIVVNERVQTDTRLDISVAAHTDEYRRFTVRNRIVLPNFSVDGSFSGVQFGIDHLLERSGIREVKSLGFLDVSGNTAHRLSFPLTRALPVTGSAEYESLAACGEPFLDGDLQVRVNRVLLGHRAIGIVFTATNTLDRNLSVEILNKTVDGLTYSNSYSSSSNHDRFILAAGCTGTIGLTMDVGSKPETVSKIGLAFRFDELTSARAFLRLDEPAALNLEGGLCFDTDHFTTAPVTHQKPQILVSEEQLRAGSSLISLKMDLRNYWDDVESLEEQTFHELLAAFTIINQSDERLKYSLDHFVFNDQRCISDAFELGTAYGGSVEKTLNIGRYSSWRDQLANMKEITSVGCDLRVKHPGGETETFPLRWTVQNCSLNGIAADEEVQAQVSAEGIIWELLSVNTSRAWYDNSQLSEQFSCSFCVRNETEEAWIGSLDTFLINHVMGPKSGKPISLTAGREEVIELTFENLDGLLQNCGFSAIENMTLYLKADDSQSARLCTFALEEPLPLSDVDEKGQKAFRERHILIDEDAEIGLCYLTVYNSGFSLTLSMRNKTDQTLEIKLSEPFAGDLALRTPFYIYSEFEVLPQSTRVEEFVVSLPTDASASKLSEDICFALTVGDRVYQDIEIHADAPLLLGSGFRCASDQLRVISAPTLPDGKDSGSSPDMEGFSFELGVVPYQYDFYYKELVDCSMFKSGVFYIEDLEKNEYWYPAMRLVNDSGEDASISIWGEINGSQYQWDKATVAAGDSYVAYARIAEQNRGAGKYDCVFYVNSTEVCSGTVDVRYKKSIVDLDTITVGDVLYLGACEQDNDLSNGKEPIEWLILDIQDGQALAVSRYALDCKPYHSQYEAVTWDHCSLREWLHDDFYHETFTRAEQLRIVSDRVKADSNPVYDLDPGSDTEDLVFLLSMSEAEGLFPSDAERVCAASAYCEAQGAELEDGACLWWLRTPGDCLEAAVIVEPEGTIGDYGLDVNVSDWFTFESYVAVRPAIRINLSGGYVTMGRYEQDGKKINGREDIEWVVLDEKDGKWLLVSRYALDCRPMFSNPITEYH